MFTTSGGPRGRDRAVEGDGVAPLQAVDAAEGEVEVGLGDEQAVGLQHHLQVAGGRRGEAARRGGFVIGHRHGPRGGRDVGQDVVVRQQHVGRDQEPRAARAVGPADLHHGPAQAVAGAEEMERQQGALADDHLGPRRELKGQERTQRLGLGVAARGITAQEPAVERKTLVRRRGRHGAGLAGQSWGKDGSVIQWPSGERGVPGGGRALDPPRLAAPRIGARSGMAFSLSIGASSPGSRPIPMFRRPHPCPKDFVVTPRGGC